MDMQAQLLAKTDSLTGIANYRMFHETLDREISRSNRMHIGFALVLMDLDDFKKINDTHGHLAGNDVLKDISHRISAMIRKQDQFARYGGEEFALLLPDTAAEGALILAERIRQEIAAGRLSWGHHEIAYTVSMGIACYHGDTSQPKDILIANADRALYLSKSKGKNCVTVA
jgi:diguanylate cyclase (GGDEF)-like protein